MLIKAENVNQVSDKVVLTQEQADKVDSLSKSHTKERIISDFVRTAELNKLGLTLDQLIRALYIGYTVEETTEEKILKMYKNPHNYYDESDGQWGAFQSGVYNTLQKLRIKIEGINA